MLKELFLSLSLIGCVGCTTLNQINNNSNDVNITTPLHTQKNYLPIKTDNMILGFPYTIETTYLYNYLNDFVPYYDTDQPLIVFKQLFSFGFTNYNAGLDVTYNGVTESYGEIRYMMSYNIPTDEYTLSFVGLRGGLWIDDFPIYNYNNGVITQVYDFNEPIVFARTIDTTDFYTNTLVNGWSFYNIFKRNVLSHTFTSGRLYYSLSRAALLDYAHSYMNSNVNAFKLTIDGMYSFIDGLNYNPYGATGFRYGVIYKSMEILCNESTTTFTFISVNGDRHSGILDNQHLYYYLICSTPMTIDYQTYVDNISYPNNYYYPQDLFEVYDYQPNYSLNDFFTTIVDVPLFTIFSLFNFEVLGVNLFALVTGLITVLLVVFVIRKLV